MFPKHKSIYRARNTVEKFFNKLKFLIPPRYYIITVFIHEKEIQGEQYKVIFKFMWPLQ